MRLDRQVSFNWIITKPHERITAQCYSVRWTGRLTPHKTVAGRIGVSGYDSMRLWVDEALIMDHGGGEKSPGQRRLSPLKPAGNICCVWNI